MKTRVERSVSQSRVSFREFRLTEERGKERLNWHARLMAKAATPTAYLLIQTPVSAPQVLGMMLATGVGGALCLMVAAKGWMLVGVLLLFVSVYLDYCDGMVFRYRGLPAVRGIFIDRFNHALIYPLTYFALSIAAFRMTGQCEHVMLGFAAAVFRDAYDSLHMYEQAIVARHRDSVVPIRVREFFARGLYLEWRYIWVMPFYGVQFLSILLGLHLCVFGAMVIGIVLGYVPILLWYFAALFAARFFSFSVTRMAVVFRGK